MIPLLVAGLAASAISAYAQHEQAQAQKDAAKKAAAGATPGVASSGAPPAYQAGQFRITPQATQAAPIGAAATPAAPMAPQQVVTAPQSTGPDMTGMWASDYSRGMAGAGAPASSRRPDVSDSWEAL